MGFRFEKPDVQEMKRLEIEVHFRQAAIKPKATDDNPNPSTEHRTICDVLDRWNKKHLISSDPLGSREEAFKNALAKAQKLNRSPSGKDDSSDEVEKYKALVEKMGARIEQLEKAGNKKQTTGAA